MVGNLAIQIKPQKPQPVQPLRQGVHQLALGSDIIENQQEHQLQNHRRRHRHVAPVTVSPLHFFIDELEVDQGGDAAQGVIRPDPFVQGEVGVEEFPLEGVLITHHGICLLIVAEV